ncbi:hypothetical protein IU448_09930 [Nocardia flavorosea]|uniref:DUF7373 family lipoprotein n=1 Tax=Nocardia flavorosea TaxID=53429 RepID=UPI001893CEE4|nr:hypothetical protein [Nocardia flavorosea]MBF6349340.1 hypothetical protein [Nocardia flavorosea]
MHTMKRLSIVLPVCVALLTATGCGDDSPASGQDVDTASLQPGNYPTTPRTAEEVRTPENIDIQEPLRLGAHVPMIMETSPRLVFNRVEAQRKILTPLMPPLKPENFLSGAPGFIAGWETMGQRRQDSNHGRTIELSVMRFAETGQATAAAQFLADTAMHGKYPPVETISIPEYPSAFGQVSKFGAVSTWIAQGPFVLKTWVGAGVDLPPDPAALAGLTKTVFDEQFAALRDYEPTPPDQMDDLPVDRDGILTYTLAGSEPAAELVMSPVVALNFLERPDLAKRAFEDAHVDLAVHAAARIYRAGDPDAASRLKAYFISQQDSARQRVDSPPGLPAAYCTDDPESTGSLSCVFTVGHYTVIIEGSNQIQDLHQQVAAQYLLLEQAP